jgi:hypothetical protein
VKYSPDCDVVVYKAIALTGQYSDGWNALGISEPTGRNWLFKYPSFKQAVDKAVAFYNASSPEALKLGVLAHLVSALQPTRSVTEVTRTTNRQIHRNGQNQIILEIETEETKEHTKNLPLQKWEADKILANARGLDEAIALVIAAGYQVSEP